MQFKKIFGLMLIFSGTIFMGVPVGLVIIGALGTVGGILFTFALAIPGMLMWFFGFRLYDKSTLIETSDTTIDGSLDLSLIRVVRVASNLDTIISRLFKVVMIVAAIFGISVVILVLGYLEERGSLNKDDRNFFFFSIPFLSIFYILLQLFGLNLRINGRKLAQYLEPLDQNKLELVD